MAITTTKLAATGQTPDQAAYSITVSPAAAGVILLGFTAFESGGTSLSSVTSDGGTPVQVAAVTDTEHKTYIYALEVGSAGDVEFTVTYSATISWILYGAILMEGANTTVYDTATSFSATFPASGPLTLNLPIDTADGGAVFAFGGCSVAGGTPTSFAFDLLTSGNAPYINAEQYGQMGYADIGTGATDAAVAFVMSGSVDLYSPSAAAVSYQPAATGSTYTLVAGQGSFTLTGEAAVPKAARKITATAGSFTLSGKPAVVDTGSNVPGSLSFSSAVDEILTLFKTAWDTTGYDAYYESVRDQRQTDTSPWASVMLRHIAGYQSTLSSSLGSRMFTREGVLTVRIYVHQGEGLQTAYGLAKVVADAYEGGRTDGGAWFRNVRLNEEGRDGEFYLVSVLIDFQYDEIK